MIFAMCTDKPVGKPSIVGSDAKIAVSQARPAISTSTSSASARRNGPMPIWPTMCAASVTSSSVSAGMSSMPTHRAGAHRRAQHVARQIGAQHAEAEMQPLGARDLADDRERRLQMRRRARRTGGTDHQRHVDRARAQQHLAQIAPRRGRRGRHLALAEIGRPDIDRAHVAADQVRLACQAGIERRRRNAIAELPRRPEEPHRPPRAADIVQHAAGCAHISTPSSGACCCAPYTSRSPGSPAMIGRASTILIARPTG